MSSSCLALPALPMNGHSPADYAPRSHPERRERLNQNTTLAVIQLGEDAAREIDKAIEEGRQVWESFEAKMQDLKDGIRERTLLAHDEVVALIGSLTVIGDSISHLSAQLKKPQTNDTN